MRLLHVGCGPRGGPGAPIPALFDDYDELRMDIDPAVDPDLVGDITDIDLPDGSVDGVYASHVLEHVEQWNVHQALCEVLRVLRPGGVAVIVTPDLERVAREILEHPGMIEAVTLVARSEGILLDPVYSGKAMAGLIDLVRKGQLRKGENVVFLHTGGAVGLYGYLHAFPAE